MQKRLKLKRERSDSYRFESPLHVDAVIPRLKRELKSGFSLFYYPHNVRVAHEKLHDSYYFEVRHRGNNWLPERVVTGAVRQLNEHSSLVECEIKTAERYLPGFEFAAAGILIAALITTLDGSAIRELVVLLWALLAIATVFVLWLRRRLSKRVDPLMARIQNILSG